MSDRIEFHGLTCSQKRYSLSFSVPFSMAGLMPLQPHSVGFSELFTCDAFKGESRKIVVERLLRLLTREEQMEALTKLCSEAVK